MDLSACEVKLGDFGIAVQMSRDKLLTEKAIERHERSHAAANGAYERDADTTRTMLS